MITVVLAVVASLFTAAAATSFAAAAPLPANAGKIAAARGVTAPDGPISGQLVPALRGTAAAVATAPLTSQRLRNLNATQHPGPKATPLDITPWSGTIHNGWGAFPNVTSSGAQATHTVNPRIAMTSNDPDVIYAPTLFPSGTSCIEVSTFYWKGGNGVGAWNWCSASPAFDAVAWIDSSFVSTYTVPFNGLPAYTVRDVQTDPVTNSWTAYLYNYTTRSWDALFTSADTSKLGLSGGGWDMYEIYTDYNPATGEGYYCTETYGSMWWATNIRIRVNGSWQLLTPGNSSVAPTSGVVSTDYGCYSLSFTLQTPNSNWQVTH